MRDKLKPDWAGDDFLSRFVNILIQTKLIYNRPLACIPFHQILGQAGRLPHKKKWLRVGWASCPS